MAHRNQGYRGWKPNKVILAIVALLGTAVWLMLGQPNSPITTAAQQVDRNNASGAQSQALLANISPDGEYVAYVHPSLTNEVNTYLSISEKKFLEVDHAKATLAISMLNDDGKYRVADAFTFFSQGIPQVVTHVWMGNSGHWMVATAEGEVGHGFVGGQAYVLASTPLVMGIKKMVGASLEAASAFVAICMTENEVRIVPFYNAGDGYAIRDPKGEKPVDISITKTGWLTITYASHVQIGQVTRTSFANQSSIPAEEGKTFRAGVSNDNGTRVAITWRSEIADLATLYTKKDGEWTSFDATDGFINEPGKQLTVVEMSPSGERTLSFTNTSKLLVQWHWLGTQGSTLHSEHLPKDLTVLAARLTNTHAVLATPAKVIRRAITKRK